MPYDEKLADRVRNALKGKRRLSEKKMFGGICILHRGNMVAGILEDRLMVRVGPDQYETCLKLMHVKPMDLTGRPMKGLVFVESSGIRTKAALTRWLERGLEFTRTLPAK